MRKRLLLASLFIPFFASSQIFWTENFNNGCTAGCDASAYVGGNGAWTQTILGPEGADPNLWYVSCAENGHTNNICGTGCVAASATATLASLHVGANPSFIGDIGAAYDAGGLCGILTCPQTNRRIESPTINCTGYSNITLSFNYIEAGTPPNDDASIWYYNGAIWSLLVNTPATNNAGCGGQGRWTTYTFVLPASANNNANVKIGFLWVNNDDGVGTDPSFAVDDMTLSVVNNNPPTAAITASATSICAGSSITFSDNSTGGPTSWAWTFPSGSPANAAVQNPGAVTWNNAGTYTVTLTATNGNGNTSATQVITVNPSPTVTATANPQVICTGNNTTLTASGAPTYVWQPGNLNGSPQVVTPAATTTYTVTGTDANGCQDTGMVTVTVQICAAPVAAFTASATSVCEGVPVNFTDNTTGGPTTWAWTFPSGTPNSSAVQNPSGIVWNSAGTYTVSLTASNINGNSTATVVITVNPAPTVTAITNNAAVCAGNQVTLTGSGANTYLWQPGNLNGNPQNITPAATTTYTVIGTDANGCIDTGLVTVVVNNLPTVTATTTSPICIGDSATLNAAGAQTYQWQPINASGQSVVVTPAATTTYTVTGTDINGCQNTANVTLVVQPCVPPVAAMAMDNIYICQGSCVTFSDISTGGPTSWNWQFQGGNPASSVLQNPGTVCYAAAGTYDVVLIVSNPNGSDTMTAPGVITVYAPPTLIVSPNTTVAIGNFVTLTANGGNGTYTWTPAGTLSCPTCASTEASPTVTTTYYVTYTDANGCTATDSVVVDVVEEYSIFVPDAFTPNNDGTNDVLFVRGAGIKTLSFQVYDRVGEKIFESTSTRDGWDGTFRGQPMNTGVFVYYVTAEFYNGTTEVLKGNVTLVR